MGAFTGRIGTGRSRAARRLVCVLAAVALGTAVVGTYATSSSAAAPVGTVTLTVNRDYFGDGTYHPTDSGQPGMAVVVTDVNGTAAQKTTNSTGSVTITAADGLTPPYRIDVSIPAPYSSYLTFAPVKSGPWPATFAPATSFADPSNGTNVALRVPVWNAADFGQATAQLAVPVEASFGLGGLGAGTDALVVRPNAPTGSQQIVATQQQIGTTFGVAYDRTGRRIFTSAFAKAYSAYGPGGGAAIYVTDPNSAAPNGSVFTTVQDVNQAALTAHAAQLNGDYGFFGVPGTQSLGGLAVSDDGTKLYTINLADKRLITIDIANPSTQTATAIPSPGCTAGAWRPFGLSVHNNTLYVGGVCDASSANGDRSKLSAAVYSYSAGSFSLVYQHGLDFTRGTTDGAPPGPTGNADVDTHWNPWTSTYVPTNYNTPTDNFLTRPEPELATIAFDADGSMILGFRDRSGDKLGRDGAVQLADGTVPGAVSIIAGGDVNRVCNLSGTYVWEGETSGGSSCPNHNVGTNSGGEPTGAAPAGVQEFYPGEYAINVQREAGRGSVVLPAGSTTVTSTLLDPQALIFSEGLGFFDRAAAPGQDPGVDVDASGGGTSHPNSHSVVVQNGAPNGTGFGKANGLGAIALLAAAPPVQIGNRVWLDSNRNGVQDAGELSLQGATVSLIDKQTGQAVASTTTDSNGAYYFGGPASDYQLTPGADYTVKFDVSSVTNLPTGVSASSLRYTTQTSGGDNRHDSNTPTLTTLIAPADVTAPSKAGEVDHSIDAGVYSRVIPVPPTGPIPPGNGQHPPTRNQQPHTPAKPPGTTTTTTTVLIETGGPGGPQRGSAWYLVSGGLVLAVSVGAVTAALRRRRPGGAR